MALQTYDGRRSGRKRWWWLGMKINDGEPFVDGRVAWRSGGPTHPDIVSIVFETSRDIKPSVLLE